MTDIHVGRVRFLCGVKFGGVRKIWQFLGFSDGALEYSHA